jgi:hypothetical protein
VTVQRIVIEFHPKSDPEAVHDIKDQLIEECMGRWLPYGPREVWVEEAPDDEEMVYRPVP